MVLTVDHKHEGYGFEVGGDGAFVGTFAYPRARPSNQSDLAVWVNDPENTAVTPSERQRFNWMRSKVPFAGQYLKCLRPMAMSLRHSFGPPYEPGVPVTRVMIRGECDNPGEAVEAGFPSVITGHQDPAPIRSRGRS